MKLFKRILEKRKNNEKGLTLVEVIVATTIFGILAGMICTAANYSMRQQTETVRWNEQTDKQTSYLSQKRNEDQTGKEFNGGTTSYKLVLVPDAGGADVVLTDENIGIYQMNTIHDKDAAGNDLPTFEDAQIYFFRVDNP